MTYYLSRRNFLHYAGVGLASSIAATPVLSQAQGQNPLRIPALLTGQMRAGVRHYDLTMQQGSTEFFSGINTDTLGLNGSYLGPTLKLVNGEQASMHVRNTLGEVTTLHWHGLHVPAKADGGPALEISPGTIWDADFTVMQHGGTFWYHAHTMGQTGSQVYRGLAGMIQLEDDETTQPGLPNEYGIDDIPVIIQDKRFSRDGAFSYIGMHRDVMAGFFGNTVMVNGTLNPYFEASTTKIRLRLLNASNARTYNLSFSDNRQFSLLGSGGSLLETPLPLRSLVLAPAERADIVVDLANGQNVNLLSTALPSGSPFLSQGMMRNMQAMNGEVFTLLTLRPQSGAETSAELPRRLTVIERIPEASAVRTRRFQLGMTMGMGMMGMRGGGGGRGMNANTPFNINGQSMDMSVINERVAVDSTEIWEIVNDTMMMHPFHIHHNQFQLLDRNGQPPRAEEMAYKDTVKVGPGETVRFIMRFENFSDPDTAYMYHCHILEHEDNGMMGQFVVV